MTSVASNLRQRSAGTACSPGYRRRSCESLEIRMSGRKVPVLIVGAGPVGLALAGDLGWRGVDCCLIERTDGSIYQPKMDMVGIRTMEFCRRWGIAHWVENSLYPRDYPQDNVWLESLTG